MCVLRNFSALVDDDFELMWCGPASIYDSYELPAQFCGKLSGKKSGKLATGRTSNSRQCHGNAAATSWQTRGKLAVGFQQLRGKLHGKKHIKRRSKDADIWAATAR
jgi:hypothetical protein